MTRVELVVVGRVKSPELRRATADYESRLKHYIRFGVTEVDSAGLKDSQVDETRAREATAIERHLPDGLEIVALTRDGTTWSSRKFSDYLSDMLDYGRPGAVFMIGGAHGLSEDLLTRARVRLSLSAMTLPHELARLVLTEQLYRAGTIRRGEPYHKGP